MKILLLSDNFPPETNAPASRTYEHARQWVRAGHEVTVITCAPNFPQGILYAGYRNHWHQVEVVVGICVVRVKTYMTANEGVWRRSLDHLSFMFSSVIAGLFEQRPDVVVATSPQFFCACGGWLLSALRRLPFVFELRDLWPATILAVGAMKMGVLVWSLEWVELFLYRHADRIVSVTEAFKKDLVARGIPGDRIAVVTNGVDLRHFVPQERDRDWIRQIGVEGRFVVGYVGTHGLTHGLETVLAAAKLLEDERKIIFLFVGAGAERANLQRAVLEQGISNVRFLEPQTKDRMPRLWAVCDVALIPLKNRDVFTTVIPSKMFEAMAMGIPIVMSIPDGEATRVLSECEAGIVVPPEDPPAMAEAIRRLLHNDRIRIAFGANGAKSAGNYSRDKKADMMLTVLRDVAEAVR